MIVVRWLLFVPWLGTWHLWRAALPALRGQARAIESLRAERAALHEQIEDLRTQLKIERSNHAATGAALRRVDDDNTRLRAALRSWTHGQ